MFQSYRLAQSGHEVGHKTWIDPGLNQHMVAEADGFVPPMVASGWLAFLLCVAERLVFVPLQMKAAETCCCCVW